MQTQRWLGVMPWSGALLALSSLVLPLVIAFCGERSDARFYLAPELTAWRHADAIDQVRGAIQCWVVGAASLPTALALVAMIAVCAPDCGMATACRLPGCWLWLAVSILATGATAVHGHVLASGTLGRRCRVLHCRRWDRMGGAHTRSLDANAPSVRFRRGRNRSEIG